MRATAPRSAIRVESSCDPQSVASQDCHASSPLRNPGSPNVETRVKPQYKPGFLIALVRDRFSDEITTISGGNLRKTKTLARRGDDLLKRSALAPQNRSNREAIIVVVDVNKNSESIVDTPIPEDKLSSYRIETPPALLADDNGSSKPAEPDVLDFRPISTPGWIVGDNSTYGRDPLQSTDDGDRPEIHPARKAVIDAAQASLGTEPWRSSEHAEVIQGGMFSGAANLSVILQKAGYPHVSSARVLGQGGLQDQLLKSGFTQKPMELAQPGDIYIKPLPGNTRIGIVGPGGTVYSHDKSGVFRQFKSSSGNGYVLSPPEPCKE